MLDVLRSDVSHEGLKKPASSQMCKAEKATPVPLAGTAMPRRSSYTVLRNLRQLATVVK
jgi:hypothetical protein